ncbi:MAG: hypothetical protein LBI48_00665 [Burkholderiaceae bacterium]|jgi:hypothetical protein|nr:hypothetical protein [Burkholderiaceae bacterium]
MKLICSIKPRADGTVLVQGDGKTWTFNPTGEGETAADVPDALAEKLLTTGNFYPAGKADAAPTAKPPAASKTASAPAAKPSAHKAA